VKFTQAELRLKLASLGINAWGWQLPDVSYETVPVGYGQKVWDAIIDEFRANAPELLTTLQLGGGKTRVVPKWIEEAGDCDDGAFVMVAKAIIGNWINAARGGAKAGRTFGLMFFTAEPRAENRNRAGGHALVWEIDDSGTFRVYENGDGEYIVLTPTELASSFFGICL
jgi:hypothetical protein